MDTVLLSVSLSQRSHWAMVFGHIGLAVSIIGIAMVPKTVLNVMFVWRRVKATTSKGMTSTLKG